MSKQEELEATGTQRRAIAKFSYLLGINEPLETGFMTMAQAGKQIRHLSNQLKLRRIKKGKSVISIFQEEFRRRLR